MTEPSNLTTDQAARAEAIDRARVALLPRTLGSQTVRPADLVTVAEWIMRGYDDVSALVDTDMQGDT